MTEQPTRELPESPDGDRTRTEWLNEAECWTLLARAQVGRVGVIVDGAAEIYPVNYVVDWSPGADPTIVFRTDPGTKLAGLGRTPDVSFEVDDLDPGERTGWSILVKGRAKQVRELTDPDERHRVEQLPLRHWHAGPKRHSIRIVPTEVTGRRIERSDDRPNGFPTVARVGPPRGLDPAAGRSRKPVTLHGNDDVRQAMRAPVLTVDPGTTLRAAAATLGRHDIGAVAVVDGDALVGVLSERDVVRSLGDGGDPDVTRVAAAMSRPPRVVTSDSPLWAATMLMLQLGVRHLPVTQADRTVGMLSMRDALTVMERDRIIEPGSTIETVHDRLGPTSHRQPAT